VDLQTLDLVAGNAEVENSAEFVVVEKNLVAVEDSETVAVEDSETVAVEDSETVAVEDSETVAVVGTVGIAVLVDSENHRIHCWER